MKSHFVAWLLALPPPLVLLAAFLFPALEASAFLGLVVPGETAVFVGGMAAHAGNASLWSVVLAAAAGAVVGDQVGYAVGRRVGPGCAAAHGHSPDLDMPDLVARAAGHIVTA